ncbi:MAG: MlaD family protein [Pseudomonadota bacterium]
MSDAPDRPAQPVTDETRSARRIVSAVWLVPIVAVLIAVAIAWQTYRDRGVLIAIAFPDASGIEVGTTTLRYREVTVGVVEDVGFTADLNEVNVYVRVNQAIAPYLDEDASFWIVQPEVTARGVEGLNTILSGTYIEGTWDSDVGITATAFRGDERAPIVPPGVEGTAIVLRARDSARLGPGSPILYRGIEVGEVAAPRLSPDGTEIRIDAFIRAPYDRQLSTATRFWDASGVSVDLGAGGVELRIGSVAAILEGGVNFDTLISGGRPIGRGHIYNIFEDENAARASTFETPTGRTVLFSALFPSAASGLAEGATVRFRGVRVGIVTDITGFIRPDDPQNEVQLLAVLSLQPAKMGFEGARDDLDAVDFVDALVGAGLRAELVSTSILGGELAVELRMLDEVIPDTLEIGVADNPLIPTIEGEQPGLVTTAESLLTRLQDLPVEELLAAGTDLLQNLNRIAANDDTQALPSDIRALVGDGRGLVRDGRSIISSPDVAGALLDVRQVTRDLAEMTQTFTEEQLAENLSQTLEAAVDATRNIAAGTTNLETLRATVERAVASIDAILADPDTRALPGATRALLDDSRTLVAAPELRATLAELAVVAADIRGITQRLAANDAATRLTNTLEAAETAALSVADGTANLPELTASAERVMQQAEVLGESLNRLAEKANALALDRLVNATSELMETADAFLSSDDADDVPIVLVDTLEELRLTIQTIRTGGTLDNLNATLSSAAGAADSVNDAASDLPELVARLQRLSLEASSLFTAYGDGSRVNTELFEALRAATRAAEDVSSLSRTIERNPNSLLLGR